MTRDVFLGHPDGIVAVLADEPLIPSLSSPFRADGHFIAPPSAPACPTPEELRGRLPDLERLRAVVVGTASSGTGPGAAPDPAGELRCVVAAARRSRAAARLLSTRRGGALVCVVRLPDGPVRPEATACESLSGFIRSAAAELSHYGVAVWGVLVADDPTRPRATGAHTPLTVAAELVRTLTLRLDPASAGQVYLVTADGAGRVVAPSVTRELLRTDRRPPTALVTDVLDRELGSPGAGPSGPSDRVVLVTGGGGGIGRAVATGLAEQGAAVVVADLGCDADGTGRDPAVAERVVREITDRGGRAVAVCADVSRPEECRGLVAETVRTFGRVDALCHAAGTVRQSLVHDASDDDWEAVLSVHVDAARYLAEACLGPMRRQGDGSIVLFSSRSVTGSPGLSTYSTAKGAVLAYGRSLASATADSGVRVNVVLPSGRTRASMPQAPSARRRRIELLRARHHGISDPVAYRNAPEQDPETNTAPIAWLCGRRAETVSGLVLGTGGWRIDLHRASSVSQPVALSRALTREGLRALSVPGTPAVDADPR